MNVNMVGVVRVPVIDLKATGQNIKRIRQASGVSVRDLQMILGFTNPQAIYKWQKGQSLPTVDNLYALGSLLGVSMDDILVPVSSQLHIVSEQQAEPCCSSYLWTGHFGYGKHSVQLRPFASFASSAA